MLGILLWTFSDSKSFDAFIPGGVFLGLGGPFSYYTAVHVTDLLTKYRTLFVALYSGFWVAGGLVLSILEVCFLEKSTPFPSVFIHC